MTRAAKRTFLAIVGSAVLATTAAAQTAQTAPTLPSLALDPHTPPSFWNSLTLGSEVFAVSGKHVHGVGGAVSIGYRTRLADNIKLAIEAGTGYTPLAWPRGLSHGASFGFARAKVGNEIGKLTPYVMAGGALARLDNGFANRPGADTFNALFGGDGRLRSSAMVGAGVDYQINNNLSVGLGVSVQQGGFGGLR